MLVSRDELKYDFNGAQFDLTDSSERKLLAWVFDQFLYGEASGIQCGYWLYRAPHLNAATFLAKQASEELSHFRRILRIFSILELRPHKAHWAIRFLASGMIGGSWGEHVAIEMALGEGLVLSAFYAMLDTIPDPEIKKILASAIIEEERHVEFGERETAVWLKNRPRSAGLLLGLALVQYWVMQSLKGFVVRKLKKELNRDHPVAQQFEKFYVHLIDCFELRIDRLQLSDLKIRQMNPGRKIWLLFLLPFRLFIRGVGEKWNFKKHLLTETYLQDPSLEAELQRNPPSAVMHE